MAALHITSSQELCDALCELTTPSGPARPHWAKQWQGLNFYGLPGVQFMKEVGRHVAL